MVKQVLMVKMLREYIKAQNELVKTRTHQIPDVKKKVSDLAIYTFTERLKVYDFDSHLTGKIVSFANHTFYVLLITSVRQNGQNTNQHRG